jgi:hypothetical protein
MHASYDSHYKKKKIDAEREQYCFGIFHLYLKTRGGYLNLGGVK